MLSLDFLSNFPFSGRVASPGGVATATGNADPGCPVAATGPEKTARDAGMSTAEYAVGTVAAVAFAGVLYAVVSSPATRDILSSIVERALAIPF